MSPEELNILINKPAPVKEYRLYYNEQGMVTMFAEHAHPEGTNYIVLDDPDLFYKANTHLLRVRDNKLIKIDTRIQFKTGLRRGTQGQPVVKGIAALALLPTETYTEIEYYERKTNN
jgi:hypothetical protein